jgi:hypothetical protein
MFPGVNLNGAVEKAQKAIVGTADTLDSAGATARGLGINSATINSIYNQYGNTLQARAVCKMLGTTPEALKADADRLIGGQTGQRRTLADSHGQSNTQTRFPRLK